MVDWDLSKGKAITTGDTEDFRVQIADFRFNSRGAPNLQSEIAKSEMFFRCTCTHCGLAHRSWRGRLRGLRKEWRRGRATWRGWRRGRRDVLCHGCIGRKWRGAPRSYAGRLPSFRK